MEAQKIVYDLTGKRKPTTKRSSFDSDDRKKLEDKQQQQKKISPVQETTFVNTLCAQFTRVATLIETFLFFLMNGYDNYVYSPLQKSLSPVVRILPRNFHYKNTKFPIFTANIVTLSRVFLVVPIAWFLKYDYNLSAFMCVVFHDFLDHLDGIVAKVHRVTYPNEDSPLLGGFLDAFCDKIVNVLCIWTILQYTDFTTTSTMQTLIYLSMCYGVIGYETVIGVIRVQDYFLASFKENYNIHESEEAKPVNVTAAAMEGKLKEKLESTGIALLCMGIGKFNLNPIMNAWSISGIICLLLTLRMAHKSLTLKLLARQTKRSISLNRQMSSSTDNLLHLLYAHSTTDHADDSYSNKSDNSENSNYENVEMKMVDFEDDQIKDNQTGGFAYKRPKNTLMRSSSVLSVDLDTRVDKVYTVGCFDLFHHGHVTLIKRMREIGKKIIIGVHDSRSIYKLKNRVPIDSTEKRMLNVKSEADEVFCISGTDPSNFMTCIVELVPGETACYVRGDDMKDFPSRDVVESLMPIKFLPYTKGVSTTQLRKKNFAHIAPDDEKHLEKIN
jgi:cytidyltransferase-like protein